MEKNNFLECQWHDAQLLSIFIKRDKPGEQDIIQLQIKWPNNHNINIFEFYDCYGFIANMNFGIIADESILYAELLSESSELSFIREKWLKMGVDLKNLNCYKITTNSTNSQISIFSLGYREIDRTH